jgi:hypothetical protein
MEQRPLRLGDIVDDYCPRERRMTNHAIVAIVEDAIRQTRCTACEAEHTFKGKPPLRRRKDELSADVAGRGQPVGAEAPQPQPPAADGLAAASIQAAASADAAVASDAAESGPVPDDGWPANRQLIRATLPRVEGEQPAPRPIPEFTMHQRPQARGGGFRYGQGRSAGGTGNGNGNIPGRGDFSHGRGSGPADGRGGRGGSGGQGAGRPARRRAHGKRPR